MIATKTQVAVQHVNNPAKTVVTSSFQATGALAKDVNSLNRKLDWRSIKRLRIWFNKLGNPTGYTDYPEFGMRTYTFPGERALTITHGGWMPPEHILQAIDAAHRSVDDETITEFLEGTNLHSFYAECVNFKNSCGDHNRLSYGYNAHELSSDQNPSLAIERSIIMHIVGNNVVLALTAKNTKA